MLQWTRDNLKHLKWTLWPVILAFVAGFVVIPQFDSGGGGDDRVATIGDETITQAEFEREYRNLQDQYRSSLGERFTPELAQQFRLPLQAINQLAAEKLMVEEARRAGLTVTDAELRQLLIDMPGLQDESGRFIGSRRYAEVLRANGYPSPAAFESGLRENLLGQKLQAALAAGVYIPDAAVEARYRRDVEKAQIRYVEVPGSRFAADVKVEPEEVKSFFDARREEYRRPEQRVVSYLLVDANRLGATLEVPQSEIADFYGQNQADYSREEQVHARHILIKVDDNRSDEAAKAFAAEVRRRLEGGADFAAVAKEVSEDPGSKPRGGDLGYLSRNGVVPEFGEAAFSATPNQLVGPVKSSLGYHLLEVLDHRPGGQRPLEEVSNQIRQRLQNERAQAQAEQKAAALAERIGKEKLTSDEQWKGLTEGAPYITVEKSPAFGLQDNVPGVGRAPEFLSTAFELEKGEVSDPVRLPRGWAILRLDEALPPRLPELTEVETQVRQALNKQKQDGLALSRLAAARRELDAGQSLEQVASGLGVEVKDSGEFGHGQPVAGLGPNPGLTEAALALSPGQTGGPVASRLGAVLFQVTERKSWDPQEFAREKNSTRRQLEGEQAQRLLASRIESRIREDLDFSKRFIAAYGAPPEPAQKR